MLVLKEFKMDESAETFLRIRGREEGIISWLLSLVGIDPIVEMQCNRREILYRTSSVRKGQLDLSIPNTAVTGVVAGYSKPFYLLVLAAIFILGGFILPGYLFPYSRGGGTIITMLGSIIGVIFIVVYVLQKRLAFGVFNGGDKMVACIIAKRSIIEGVGVGFDEFKSAAALLCKVILDSSVTRKME